MKMSPDFQKEYKALLRWDSLEFKRISDQLKKEGRRSGLDTHTPEFDALDKEFDEKLKALKEKYGVQES